MKACASATFLASFGIAMLSRNMVAPRGGTSARMVNFCPASRARWLAMLKSPE